MTTTRDNLGQFFTPEWAAMALVERHFPDLTMFDRVVEPSCGPGAFLAAVPDYVPAVGVEIDADLAAQAMANTGRQVIVGDFLAVDLPMRPTAIIGNPPFRQSTIQAFIDRAFDLLPPAGRLGFILPCYAFQTASVVERLSMRWGLRQELIPRNLFDRLSMPLCFAVLTKGRCEELVGFALYHEHAAITRLQRRYRQLLGQGQRSAWKALTRAAMEALGGEATLAQLYAEIDGHRPTGNRYWREKVRQVVQQIGTRTGPGRWRITSRHPTPLPERIAA